MRNGSGCWNPFRRGRHAGSHRAVRRQRRMHQHPTGAGADPTAKLGLQICFAPQPRSPFYALTWPEPHGRQWYTKTKAGTVGDWRWQGKVAKPTHQPFRGLRQLIPTRKRSAHAALRIRGLARPPAEHRVVPSQTPRKPLEMGSVRKRGPVATNKQHTTGNIATLK